MREPSGGNTAEQANGESEWTAAVEAAAETVFAIEPAAGAVERERVAEVRRRLERVTVAAAAIEQTDDVATVIAALHARGAAIAIAAGEEYLARSWLQEAERRARDGDQRNEIAAALAQPERFRALVQGRALFKRGAERAARKIWEQLAKDASDGIAASAAAELKAPRPLRDGDSPSLWTFNGFGLGFAGHRDDWADGTYVATHCVLALFIPLFPLASYRVASQDEGWVILAREPLSAFARAMRYVMAGAVALTIVAVALVSHLADPERLARKRFDRALEVAASSAPDAALQALDGALTGPDVALADRARTERAGAEVIRLTAGLAPKPFRAEHVDHAERLVQRYKQLPSEAQGGGARDAVVDAIEGWLAGLGTGADAAEPRLALLRLGADVADARRSGPLLSQMEPLRIAIADARAAEQPLDALAVVMDQPSAALLQRADAIVARLVESPSTLIEAGEVIDRWAKATAAADLRTAALARRTEAAEGRAQAEAEDATPAQLAQMAKQRPWDQYVQLRLARAEIDGGALPAAAARLEKLGPSGLQVREARLVRAQLASALGKLEQADALLTGLLAGRVEAYIRASGAYELASRRVVEREQNRLRAGDVPFDLQRRYDAASTDDERSALVGEYLREQVGKDAGLKQAQAALEALADIVPVSITAGTVKLRRAQGLSGAARDAMLGEAERLFLAIRTEAEGQPRFRLGLGEIYARLGKTKESEAEFAAVIAMKDPELSLQVASVYRELGSVGRAREVATAVHEAKPAVGIAHEAAALLGFLALGRSDNDDAERWFRQANTSEKYVRAELLAIEADRLQRQGKLRECAAKFAEVARMHLEGPTPNHNNAAVAHSHRYDCTGDLAALVDAERELEKAHREAPDNPLIVGNLAGRLHGDSQLRVLRKRVDLTAGRLDSSDAESIIEAMLDGAERDAMLAELAADRSAQRATELLAQYEVLAPSNASAYRYQMSRAELRRDEAAALAVVERARRAKIDTSEARRRREEFERGTNDAELIQLVENSVQRYDDLLARRPTGKTRAALLYLDAAQRTLLGLLKANPAAITRAHDEAVEAKKLWPALDTTRLVVNAVIDEAGIRTDAAAWAKLRRTYSPATALARLAAEGASLAAAIRNAPSWAEVGAQLRADTSRPGVDDLRLARLLGDAALEARTKAVLDDKITRAARELDGLFDPGNPQAEADLAYLDKR